MSKPKAILTFGDDANMPIEIRKRAEERLAVIPYQTFIHILHCRVVPPPTPGVYYDKPTIKLGSTFKMQMFVLHSELLGDLEADYVAEFYCHNVATCEPVNDYCAAVKGKLKCDKTWLKISVEMQAIHEGIFTFSCSLHLPKSELFDYAKTRYYFAVYDDTCDSPGCHIHFPQDRIATVEVR